MSDPDAAIWRHLDGRGDVADATLLSRRLAEDPDFAARYAAICRQEALLAEDRAAQPSGRQWRPRRLARPRRAWPWLLAAGLALASGLGWCLLGPPAPVAATVAICGPSARDGSGAPIVQGQDLAPGQRLVAGSESLALTAPDGSRLELDAGGTLTLPEVAEPWRLQAGRLLVEARPQPADQPLRIRCPEAEIAVVGTRFSLATGDGTGVLLVEQGRVRFSAGTDSVLVAAGEEARTGRDQPIVAGPQTPSGTMLAAFSFDEATPPPGWIATSVPVDGGRGRCLEAVPSGDRSNPIRQVLWQGPEQGLATYDDGLVLCARVWIDPAAPWADVWLSHADFSGRHYEFGQVPRGRWWQVVMPLKDFTAPARVLSRPSRPGERIHAIIFQIPDVPGARLLVDEVRLLRR